MRNGKPKHDPPYNSCSEYAAIVEKDWRLGEGNTINVYDNEGKGRLVQFNELGLCYDPEMFSTAPLYTREAASGIPNT